MKRIAAIVVLLWLAAPPCALAGGLILYEAGTPEVGLASAGWSARAEDAATILTNPAGMTRLKHDDLLLGVQALYASVQFSPGSATTTSGGDGGNPVGWFPSGGLYYVNPTTDHLRLGVAVTGNFGLGLKYDEGWVGRYYAQEATLLGVSVLPAVAWKISDSVSIGGAVNAMYGILDTTVGVNNPAPATPDGSLKLKDNVWGIGANLGFLFERGDGTRFGFTYTSPVKLDFSAEPEFSGLAPGLSAALRASGLLDARLDLSMTVPQTAMASFDQPLGERWRLLGNVGWQDWSSFGKVDVQVTSASTSSLTVDQNFKDTWHAALGAQVKAGSSWTVSFGAAYDSSCVDDADRSPALPVGESLRIGVGGRRPLNERLDLGIAYELLWGGDLAIDQERGPLAGRIEGSYDSAAMHFFVANLRWKL